MPEYIDVPMTAEEYALVKAAARTMNMCVNEFVRTVTEDVLLSLENTEQHRG